MRRCALVLLVLALLGAACSSAPTETIVVGSDSGGDDAGVADEPVETTTTLATPTTTEATTTTAPTATSTTTAPTERLEPDDVLLREEHVAAPWEFQYRETDQPTHEGTGSKTSCGPLGEIDQHWGLVTARSFWWRDGGNLEHTITPFTTEQEASNVVALAQELADTCTEIDWGEGPPTPVRSIESGLPGVVIIEFGEANDSRMVSYSSHGNLLSSLALSQWNVDGVAADDGTELIQLQAVVQERLLSAGPERPNAESSTTSITTTTTTLPSQPEVITEPVEPIPDEILKLLLLEDVLGFDERETELPENGDSAVPADDCPATKHLNAIDSWSLVARSWAMADDDTGVWLRQVVAEAPDAQLASRSVEQLVGLFECEAEGALDEEQVSLSLELVEIAEADMAVRIEMYFADVDLGGESVFAAVGNHIVFVSYNRNGAEQLAEFDEIIALAVQRIAEAAEA